MDAVFWYISFTTFGLPAKYSFFKLNYSSIIYLFKFIYKLYNSITQ